MIVLKFKQLGVVFLLITLTACGIFSDQKDGAPSRSKNASSVPNAVPRDEPKSKYGNPAHYEVFGKRYYVLQTSRGYKEKGIASWYGTKFHGRRTSSGEKYDMYAMTAAHKTLPLPTYAEVTNLSNGKKVIVKINDRGPFHGNRLIDLSYSAATQLGIIARGTGMVEVRAISASKPGTLRTAAKINTPIGVEKPDLFLQVGAFSTENKARQLQRKIRNQIKDNVLIVPLNKANRSLYRVRIGPLSSIEYADSLSSKLVRLGFNDAHVVIE